MQRSMLKANFCYLIGSLLLFGVVLSSQPMEAQTSTQIGEAVYYADYLNGQRTASGELYNKFELTCAHMTFPFGTLLRVTRLDNNQSITVRVNDRGPFIEDCSNCIIDLSWAAADQIGLTLDGKSRVSLQVVGQSSSNPKAVYAGTNNYASSPSGYNQGNYSYNNTTNGYGNQNVPSSYSQGANYGYGGQGTATQQQQQYNNGNTGAYYGYSSGNTAQNPNTSNRQSAFSRNNNTGVYPSNVPQSYGYTSSSNTSNNQAYKSPNANNANSDIKWLPTGQNGYAVQLASYGNLENARRQAKAWAARGVDKLYLKQINQPSGPPLYRLVVGPFPSRSAAETEKDTLYNRFQLRGFVTLLN